MRTTQRDQSGLTTFAATIIDNTSGSGVAQPGNIPYTFTRTGTGIYVYRIDPRLVPIGGAATFAGGSGSLSTQLGSLAAGTFQIVVYNSASAGANAAQSWTITARDMRT